MKTKIRNIILFIVAVIAVDQIGGRTLDYLRDRLYAAHPTADKTYYIANAVDADIVIMGASNATGSYIPRQIADSMGMTCYNIAMSGRFADYQCCLLRLMLRQHKPKYIIWEIGEFAFSDFFADMDYNGAVDIYPYYGGQRVEESKSQRAFRLLDPLDSSASEYVRSYIDRKDKWQWLRMLSRLYRHNSKLMDYLLLIHSQDSDSLLGYEPLPSTGYEYPEYKEETRTVEEYEASFSQARYETIKRTIDYCHRQGVKVIITSSPRYVKGGIKDGLMYRKMCELADECRCPYIEFLDDERFTKDNTLFHDAGHLNSRGAEEYMKIFIPKLKEIIE